MSGRPSLWLSLGILCTALSGAVTARAEEPRRDPKGQRGISPFWEAIHRADGAAVARDFPTAIAAYRSAIEAEAQNPLGHLRLHEVQLASGDLIEAEASLDAALRFSDKDPGTRAKVLFIRAAFLERKRDIGGALAAWRTYQEHLASYSQVMGYAAAADARIKVLQIWKELAEASAVVKKRIDERLRVAEEKTRADAKASKDSR